RSLAGQHPGVGDHLTAAALQLRARAARPQLHARARSARVGRTRRAGARTNAGVTCLFPIYGEVPGAAGGWGPHSWGSTRRSRGMGADRLVVLGRLGLERLFGGAVA